MRKIAMFAALLAVPGTASAQALVCTAPRDVPTPRPDLPSASEPARKLAIGSYTLAVTWGPQFCKSRRNDDAARFQCNGGNRFGFTLHGLWPDGTGKLWPQYCEATDIVPRAVIQGALCATPSAQLIQHEWAKHGTCMQTTPAAYFERSTRMFGRLRFPDMDALSRRRLTAGMLANAVARANPGMPARAIRVTTDRKGWLDELWICLDTGYRYELCRAGSGGVPFTAPVKIWRGHR